MVDSDRSGEAPGPPSPEEFDEDEVNRIVEFLSKQSAVRILEELQDGPKRFVVLRDTIGVSKATIQDRINEAQEIGLISETPDYTSGGGYKRHPLTAKGQVIADELERTDLARIRKELRKLKVEFDDQIEEFEDSLNEKSAQLNEEFARRLNEEL